MHPSQLLRPDHGTPLAPSASGSLPRELEAEALRRLSWIALYVALSGAGAFVLNLLVGWHFFGPMREVALVVAPAVLVLSLAVFVAIRSGRVPPERAGLVGPVYAVLVATGLSLLINSQPWPKERALLSWSPVAVWMLVQPLLFPATTLRTIVTGLLVASTDPLAMLLFVRLGWYDVPSLDAMVRRFFPNYGGLVPSLLAARMLYGLGAQLKRARELGSYRLVERLGQGGMGEVWRASHAMLARPAAIKLIRPESIGAVGAERDQVLRRFEREAQATALLCSPHTIGIYDFGASDDGAFYYVMELLDGMDLESLVARHGPQPPARVVHLLRQACHSLAEAHQAGMVHRDIKPANLFVCRYGLDVDFVKVLDFGIVAPGNHPGIDAKITQDGTILGTPAFMAPELATGERPVDARTDVYALGCVAYWLLTGQLVFEAKTAMGLLTRHVSERPLPPSMRAAQSVPPELDAVVMSCLAKNPEQRPRDARDLGERLASLDLERGWGREQADSWWQQRASSSPPASATPTATTQLDVGRQLGP